MALKTTGKKLRKGGFTLVELLVVIAIGAIIATLAISSYAKVIGSGMMTTTTQAVIGLLDQARQTAITRNCYVEVRFYKLPLATDSNSGPLAVYRAMQSFVITNTDYVPLSKVLFFPTPMVLQSTPDFSHSSLLDPGKDSSLALRTPASWGTVIPPVTSGPPLASYQNNYAVTTFRFTPKGNLNLDASQQWFITLISSRDKITANNLPANYSVLQVDGFTGKTSYYRP